MQSNKPSVPENQKVYIEDEFNDNPIGESESPSLKTRAVIKSYLCQRNNL